MSKTGGLTVDLLFCDGFYNYSSVSGVMLSLGKMTGDAVTSKSKRASYSTTYLIFA